MKRLSLLLSVTVLFVSHYCFGQDTIQQVVDGRKNAAVQITKPYVILISIDGLRYDYVDKYDAPNLKRLRAEGVQAKSMIPSYPSVTFPNHYTVATGMYPSHHGLVYNQFYDRNRKASYSMSDRRAVEDGTWYGGVPIWVLAEQQGMVTASYHFVGTEAAIQQTLPTYWYKFSEGKNIDFRIARVIDWLRMPMEVRPHLITFYMSDVDHAGHMFGPETEQTKQAVLFVDSAIGKLTQKVAELHLPVNFILLADHGMATVDTTTKIRIAPLIDTSKFIIRGGGTSLHLYAKNPEDIKPTYELLKSKQDNFTVYLRENIPSKWHYNTGDDKFNRIGDIFIAPTYPKVLTGSSGRVSPGAHGFDPAIQEMHATFYAWGPHFKQGKTIPSFENVHVYPLIAKILGLNYTHEIDGKLKVLKPILK